MYTFQGHLKHTCLCFHQFFCLTIITEILFYIFFCPVASHFTQNKNMIYDIKIQFQYIPLNKHSVFLPTFPPNTTTVPLFMVLTKSKQWNYHAHFQGLTMVLIKIPVFCNMILCSIAVGAGSSSGLFLPIQHYSTTSKKTAIHNTVITLTQNFLAYTVQNS